MCVLGFLLPCCGQALSVPCSPSGELGERQHKAVDSADPRTRGLLLTAGLRGSARAVLRHERALARGFGQSKKQSSRGWVLV